MGGDRECSSPSLGLNRTAWPARPDSRGGQGWDQHSPLALCWVCRGSPGEMGFLREDEGMRVVQHAGGAASPISAEGTSRQCLPEPSPGSQTPCLAPPPWLPPQHQGSLPVPCLLPPTLAAAFLPALLALDCTGKSLSSLQCSSDTRGCQVPKPPSTPPPVLQSCCLCCAPSTEHVG